MRRTVDEKLHNNSEKRLGQSYRTITVKAAQYDTVKHMLQLEVTDSRTLAQTVTVFVASTGQTIGTLSANGTFKGRFGWPVNTQTITLASSLAWSITTGVTAK